MVGGHYTYMNSAKKVGAIVLFTLSGFFAVVGVLPLLDDPKEYYPLSFFLLALAILFLFLGRKSWKKANETPAKGKVANTPMVESPSVLSKTASQSLEEALRSSNSMSVFAKTNIQKVNKMLLPNEAIKYAVCTNVEIIPNLGSLDAKNAFSFKTHKNKVYGIVVITDRRIVFCGADKTKQISLQNIQSVDDANNYSYKGQLRVIGLTEVFILDLLKEQMLSFKLKLEEARSEEKASNNSSSVTTNTYVVSDSATELKHYAELLKDGIITQGEFEAKKKQLLGL